MNINASWHRKIFNNVSVKQTMALIIKVSHSSRYNPVQWCGEDVDWRTRCYGRMGWEVGKCFEDTATHSENSVPADMKSGEI
jgi:hypothetical protein